jgi:diadenosine tetraphosphate (Ap4A) HIT family hydrolase
MTCPFCERIRHGPYTAESTDAVAVRDAYPVTAGHTLVIPRRHVSSIYDLPEAERADVWTLVGQVRSQLAEECSPQGF